MTLKYFSSRTFDIMMIASLLQSGAVYASSIGFEDSCGRMEALGRTQGVKIFERLNDTPRCDKLDAFFYAAQLSLGRSELSLPKNLDRSCWFFGVQSGLYEARDEAEAVCEKSAPSEVVRAEEETRCFMSAQVSFAASHSSEHSIWLDSIREDIAGSPIPSSCSQGVNRFLKQLLTSSEVSKSGDTL
ncbi:MAG: hypothetical protein EOP04_15455 [Proteobacteria bacterium]|nr:MAG: hypothetical protein EOP04_15455 [Pseudomonadota bacterium]